MASILSLLLRPRFPQIKCLAYSCVSAIFSRELAETSSEWIYSCNVGKDMFGRLSWHSARDLRDQLLDVLRRSKTSKAKIFYSLIRPRGVPIDELLYQRDEVPDDPIRNEIQQKIDSLKATKDHHLDHVHMYMPGRIMYFEKTHTEIKRGCLFSTVKCGYQPSWIEDRAEIQQILISTRLLLDHMCVVYECIIERHHHYELTLIALGLAISCTSLTRSSIARS